MRQSLDRYAIPDIVTGYLPQLDGAFSVVIPEATINLCTNPSFELNTTGYTAYNGAMGKYSATQYPGKQRRGFYSLMITPNVNYEAGVFYTMALTAGQSYAFSVDLWGESGKWYNLYVADASPTRLSPLTRVQGTGYWERISVVFTEFSSLTRYFYLTRSAYDDTNPFYTDGWQIENKDHATTYCDGDCLGFVRGQVDFGWLGIAHASASFRTGQTKAGGKEVNLKDLGLTILAVIGLGLAPVGNIAIPNVDGGSYYQTSVRKDRQFTIAGQLSGVSFPELQRTRASLQAAFDTFNLAVWQPLLLKYQLKDEDGNPLSEKVNIRALYNSGLSGQYDNDFAENVGIVFDSYLPMILREGETVTDLTYQQIVTNANYVMMRDTTGLWKAMGTGANIIGVSGIVYNPVDGCVYAFGPFTSMGGVANTSGIAKWNGTTWTSLGTGVTGGSDVYSVAVDAAGNVYAGGGFTQMGGVANTASVAKWNGSTWSALSTGTSGYINAMTVDQQGNVYVAGLFALAGGVANTKNIAKWNGSTWSALGTGINAEVFTLSVSKDNILYAGGNFTLAGGVANTASIAKWNGTVWSPLSTGTSAIVYAMAFGLDGILYAGGTFTTIGGVSANYIAKWNGTTWSAMGTGLYNSASPACWSLGVDPNSGLVYIGGLFSSAGGVNCPDSLCTWNGSTYLTMDVVLPSTWGTVYGFAFDHSGNMYIGFAPGGSATSAYVTTLTYNGIGVYYPLIKFTGPGTVYHLKNANTGKYIYFNLTLAVGEVATLNLDPSMLSFTSSFRGNIRDTILRGSALDFFLMPGQNLISVFVAGTTTAATKVMLLGQDSYNSLDATIR